MTEEKPGSLVVDIKGRWDGWQNLSIEVARAPRSRTYWLNWNGDRLARCSDLDAVCNLPDEQLRRRVMRELMRAHLAMEAA